MMIVFLNILPEYFKKTIKTLQIETQYPEP
jgi:hypothetical protein